MPTSVTSEQTSNPPCPQLVGTDTRPHCFPRGPWSPTVCPILGMEMLGSADAYCIHVPLWPRSSFLLTVHILMLCGSPCPGIPTPPHLAHLPVQVLLCSPMPGPSQLNSGQHPEPRWPRLAWPASHPQIPGFLPSMMATTGRWPGTCLLCTALNDNVDPLLLTLAPGSCRRRALKTLPTLLTWVLNQK